MGGWRLAYSLDKLRTELNARWPNRDKSSDGTIGDASHAASASDHNPNSEGVVCAYDVDTDLDGTDDSNDPEMVSLVEHFRTHPHPDLKYVIFRGRIFSAYAVYGYPPYEWRPYTKDPHISHPHVSVGKGTDGKSAPGTYDNTSSWLAGFGQPPKPPPKELGMAVSQTRDKAGRKWFFFLKDGVLHSSVPGVVDDNLLGGSWKEVGQATCESDGLLVVAGLRVDGQGQQALIWTDGGPPRPDPNVAVSVEPLKFKA